MSLLSVQLFQIFQMLQTSVRIRLIRLDYLAVYPLELLDTWNELYLKPSRPITSTM